MCFCSGSPADQQSLGSKNVLRSRALGSGLSHLRTLTEVKGFLGQEFTTLYFPCAKDGTLRGSNGFQGVFCFN